MAFTISNTLPLPLTPILITLPVHILLIVTLIRYRRTTVFNTAYFKILLSISINDIFFFAFVITWSILAQWFDVIQKYPTAGAVLRMGGARGFYKGTQVALVAIAINRFINVKYPLKAKILWTEKHTMAAILLQYGTFAFTLGAHFPPKNRIYFVNSTQLVGGMPSHWKAVDPTRQFIIAKSLSTFNMIASVMVSAIYAAIFVTLRTTANANPKDPHHKKVQKKLSFQGLMLSILMVVQGFLVVLRRSKIYGPPWMTALIAPVTRINYYTAPFIALLMSKELYQHAKMVMGFSTPQVAPKKTGTKANERHKMTARHH